MSSIEKPPQPLDDVSSDDKLTEDSSLRYTAYANRIRTILRASHRYVAYTSDIGESFRPVAHPFLVKAGYGVSWMYILGDVSYYSWIVKMKSEGRWAPGLRPWDTNLPARDPQAAQAFLASNPNMVDNNWGIYAVKRALFQSIASMGLPAFTIHSSVRYSSVLFKNAPKTLKTYGPVGIGLAIVPLLPYVFDEPVEAAVDWAFEKGEELLTNKPAKV
ncbi:uncharacterized protein CANTADRAFT_5748 [Suhomyces tanzawaensis NRRL Y-17324]|uniref:Mitochondrial fission process protein 1 n=1 Tax=Suhomyces tanzawaensis NRRL Y-17324 TaxID=984487 RepID=A0A1E4SKP0_9ASCO|nr:uncharacterized protein CANTADRAFT_5748 [Suhomyces tanzawaensis NRRL Y-17324]ODV80076.1 hypothetical protein CANTADRAFT_5748 [Suhomyces tanzawaensis NRRL Y-17324]